MVLKRVSTPPFLKIPHTPNTLPANRSSQMQMRNLSSTNTIHVK